MLKDSFFTIHRIQREKCEDSPETATEHYHVDVTLAPDHAIYEGHFPGNPVVPGVCQLRMITEIISEIEGQKVSFREADQVKFLSMINPHEHPELIVKLYLHKSPAGSLEVTASIHADETIFFKCKTIF